MFRTTTLASAVLGFVGFSATASAGDHEIKQALQKLNSKLDCLIEKVDRMDGRLRKLEDKSRESNSTHYRGDSDRTRKHRKTSWIDYRPSSYPSYSWCRPRYYPTITYWSYEPSWCSTPARYVCYPTTSLICR